MIISEEMNNIKPINWEFIVKAINIFNNTWKLIEINKDYAILENKKTKHNLKIEPDERDRNNIITKS